MAKKIIVLLLCVAAAAAVYFYRYSTGARTASHLARGERYFQAGQFEKAKLEYLNLLRMDSRAVLPTERLGIIWLKQGVPAQALPFLLRAKELAPANSAIDGTICQALFDIADYGSARRQALGILRRSPEDDFAWEILAEATATEEQLKELEEKLKQSNWSGPGKIYASAIRALRRKELDAAEKLLQETLAKNANAYRAHRRMAEVLFLKREGTKADESIKLAAERAPARSLEKLGYADFLIQTGKIAPAKESLNVILKEAPDYVPAHTLLGRIALIEKAYDAGLAGLEAVFRIDPINREARTLQGQLQLAKGNPGAAIETLERLTKVYPKAQGTRFELGRAYALADRTSDAIASLQEAIALNPNHLEAHLLLAELNLRAGQPQAVVESLPQLLARHPQLATAEFLLADAYQRLKRYEEAAAIYRKLAESAAQKLRPLVLLGSVLRLQQKPEEARVILEKAEQLEPGNLVIVSQLVDMDIERRDFASADTRLSRLPENVRTSGGGRVIEARIHGAQKSWDKAEEALLKAIEKDPDSEAGYQLLVSLYYENGRLEEAVKRLQEKLDRSRDDLGSRLLLARLQEERKEFASARAAYEEVVSRKPGSIVALNNLAYLLAEQFNETERAEELSRKARTLQPGDPAVADTLGWVLYRRGNYDAALALLRESATKLGERGELPTEVSYHVGMANSAMGQMEAAKAALSKAAEGKRDFPDKGGIAARIQLLDYQPSAQNLSVEALEAMTKDKPGDPLVQLRLGDAYASAGKHREAEAAYEAALKANPKLAMAAARLAGLNAGKNATGALEYAKLARSLAPSDPEIAAILGPIAARTGDVTWAYGLLQESSTNRNATPQTLYEFALVAYRLGKTKEASNALQKVSGTAAADPKIQAYRRVLELLQQPPIPPSTEPEIQQALTLEPSSLAAHMAKAGALESKNQLQAAAKKYEEIIAGNPSFPLAKAALASVKLKLGGDWKEAHELATAARAIVPEDPVTAAVLGETSFRRNEFSRAVDFLTEAARGRKLEARQIFIMGVSYFELRDKTRSEAALNEALAAGLAESDRVTAERILGELRK